MMTFQTQCCQEPAQPSESGILRDPGCRQRLRCWEVKHFFKCPIAGMCLTQTEQKQLLKKTGLLDKDDSPYDMHEKMVAAMERENRLSRRIDALLSQKLGRNQETRDLYRRDVDTFQTHFKAALESGQAAEALWIVATDPTLPVERHREIFGEIHMAMHGTVEARLKLTRRLELKAREAAQLQRRRKEDARARRALQKTIEETRREHKALQRRLASVEAENQNLRETLSGENHYQRAMILEQDYQRLKAEHGDVQRRLANTMEKLSVQMVRNRRLADQVARQHERERYFREESRAVIGEMAAMNRCDASCPSFDLCRKRVLIVGGITRMESLYRELIEGCGGLFDYHDGYVKKGARSLESSFKRADMVLCPVNCNSHAACTIVKNLGKKHNKQVHMLASSSLNAVSQVIRGEDAGECMLN